MMIRNTKIYQQEGKGRMVGEKNDPVCTGKNIFKEIFQCGKLVSIALILFLFYCPDLFGCTFFLF